MDENSNRRAPVAETIDLEKRSSSFSGHSGGEFKQSPGVACLRFTFLLENRLSTTRVWKDVSGMRHMRLRFNTFAAGNKRIDASRTFFQILRPAAGE